ncbi:MAG: helix-turn-helix domain-containing protein [Clostridia bacterium]|nr:helix-turn-helix domain-containing protein [Clostridia bacterium]
MINHELCALIRLAQGNRSQNQYAMQCDVSSAAITRILSGQYEPSSKTLKKLASHAYNGVTYEALMQAANLMDFPDPSNVYDAGEMITFEELGTVCAGFDHSVDEIPTGERVEIPKTMLKGGQKSDFFVLRVKGNSMYPRLIEGDRILCKRCTSVDSGDYAVVLYNGDEATVKRVIYDVEGDFIDLVPDNPEYMTKRVYGADLSLCRILGKVVKLFRDL